MDRAFCSTTTTHEWMLSLLLLINNETRSDSRRRRNSRYVTECIFREALFFAVDGLMDVCSDVFHLTHPTTIASYCGGGTECCDNTVKCRDYDECIPPYCGVGEGECGELTVKLLTDNDYIGIGFIRSDHIKLTTDTNTYQYHQCSYTYIRNNGDYYSPDNTFACLASPPQGKEYYPVGTLMCFCVDRTTKDENKNSTTIITVMIDNNTLIPLTLSSSSPSPSSLSSSSSSWKDIPSDVDFIPWFFLCGDCEFEIMSHPS